MSQPKLDFETEAFEDIKLVVFSLPGSEGSISYGLNAHKVREIVEVENFDPLPSSYLPYIGVMNLRGFPIPILDMDMAINKAMSLERKGLDNGLRIIVCETLGKLVGVLANTKIKMLEFSDQNISHPTFTSNKVNQEYINGIIQNEGHYIFMMNIEAVLEELNSSDGNENQSRRSREYLGKRALIVEDSQLYCKKISRFLMNLGFEVVTAHDGIEGLNCLEKQGPFDLLFSDIEMPLMNGIEMVRKVRKNQQWADLPIIFHSSISNEELVSEIKSQKLGHFITKFDEDIIYEAIKKNLV